MKIYRHIANECDGSITRNHMYEPNHSVELTSGTLFPPAVKAERQQGKFRVLKYIAITIMLVLVGCDSGSNLSSSAEDEYKEYPTGMSLNPEIFHLGFNEGHEEIGEDGRNYRFSVVKAGDINIASGKLVICDPLYLYDQKPLGFDIKPGVYPVHIAEAVIYKDNKVVDKRNAFVRIKLKESVPVEWKYIWTFGTDGGTGGYSALRMVVENKDSDSFSDELLQEFDKVHIIIEPFEDNYKNYHQYVNLNYKNSNLIAFSTGYGDGGYNSFKGLNESGEVVEILTDFGVIYWDPENGTYPGSALD